MYEWIYIGLKIIINFIIRANLFQIKIGKCSIIIPLLNHHCPLVARLKGINLRDDVQGKFYRSSDSPRKHQSLHRYWVISRNKAEDKLLLHKSNQLQQIMIIESKTIRPYLMKRTRCWRKNIQIQHCLRLVWWRNCWKTNSISANRHNQKWLLIHQFINP